MSVFIPKKSIMLVLFSLLATFVLSFFNQAWSAEETIWNTAIQAYNQKQYTDSIRLVDKLVRQLGLQDDENSYYFLAENYILDNQITDAKEIYQSLAQSAKQLPVKLSAQFRSAEIAYHQKQYQSALTMVRRLVNSSKTNFLFPKIHVLEMKALLKLGQVNKAEQKFAYLKKNYARALLDPDIKLLYGILKSYQGARLDALKIFDELKDSTAALMLAGSIHASQGRTSQAIEYYNQVITKSNLTHHKQLATYLKLSAFYKSGNLLAAKRVCNNILFNKQKSMFFDKAKLFQLLIAFNQGQYQEVQALYQQNATWIVKLTGDDQSLSYFILAETYLNLDRLEKASETYQQALAKADELKEEILLKLAYIAMRKQAWAQCHDYLTDYYQSTRKAASLAYLLSSIELYATKKESAAFNTLIKLAAYQDGLVELGMHYMADYYHLINDSKALIQHWTILKKKRKRENIPTTIREVAAQVRILIADAYFKEGKYALAKQYYQSADKLYPYDAIQDEVFPGLAWCSYKLLDYEKLALQNDKIQNIKTISKNNKQEIGLIAAHGYFNLKKYSKAIVAYQQWLDKSTDHPRMAEVYFQIGWAYYLSKAYLEAIEAWEKQVELFPDHQKTQESLIWIADTYFQAGENQQARIIYQKLIKKYAASSNQSKWKLRIAQSFYNDLQDKKAIYLFIEIIDHYPGTGEAQEAYNGIETASYRIVDALDTIPAFKSYLEKYTDSPLVEDIKYRIGAAYFKKEHFQEASKELLDYTLKFTKSRRLPHAQYYILISEEKMGNLAPAIVQAKAFIQSYPNHELTPEVTFRLASMEFESKHYEAAAEQFIIVAETFGLKQYQSRAWYNAAIAYEKTKQPQNAIKYYEKLIRNYPEDANYEMSLSRLVLLSLENQELDQARAIIALAKQQQKIHLLPKLWFHVANYYKAQGEEKEQIKYLQKISQHKTNDDQTVSLALIELAALYEKQKAWKKALMIYQQLINVTSEKKWSQAAKKRITLIKRIISAL